VCARAEGRALPFFIKLSFINRIKLSVTSATYRPCRQPLVRKFVQRRTSRTFAVGAIVQVDGTLLDVARTATLLKRRRIRHAVVLCRALTLTISASDRAIRKIN